MILGKCYIVTPVMAYMDKMKMYKFIKYINKIIIPNKIYNLFDFLSGFLISNVNINPNITNITPIKYI